MFLLLLLISVGQLHSQQIIATQVLVIGASTGGVAAAVQTARSGAKTLLVEETNMAGGMLTAAGVSCTDGNHHLNSGIWQQFREALYIHYGTRNLASGWVSNNCFEPHVADSIFKAWFLKEKNLQVKYGWWLDTIFTVNNNATGARFINENGKTLVVNASMIIDATDLGDAYAMAGAGYDIGMEDPAYSGEKEAKEKNNIIQDLTWAAILKNFGKGSDQSIEKPGGYQAADYYCSTADAICFGKPYTLHTPKVLDYGKLTTTDSSYPKYMLNWPVHGNDYYLDVIKLKPSKREKMYEGAKNKTLGFLYFLQQELGFKHIGLAADELNNGMAWAPYHREGRRLKGLVRLNINHIKNPNDYNLYKTGISVGDYPVDHHHGQYPGTVPVIDFPAIPAFNIPMGALIPKKIHGLIVCEKGISVSNIANGSTRLQPVVMLTGQAAGIMAAQCVKNKLQPRQLNVRSVQQELLKNKAYLLPFYDITPLDAGWEAMQRVAAAGLLIGEGKAEAWENKLFIYPDSTMGLNELENNIARMLPGLAKTKKDALLTRENILPLITRYNQLFVKQSRKKLPVKATINSDSESDMENNRKNLPLTRRQVAETLDKYLLLVRYSDVNINGDLIFQ